MPKPKPGENQSDFISRCIPIVMNEGTAENNDQAAAICYSLWEDRKMENTLSMNDQLLQSIRGRKTKKTPFGFGITTADKYVMTLLNAVGSDMCHRVASKDLTSFSDVLTKAANTLVYSNEDAEVHEKATLVDASKLPEGVELPKNCLMIFRHTLTTPRKDRDGDILHSEGMIVDPKLLLLWQHMHTVPIGKMLAIATQNTKTLDLWSCIVDMNEISHDSAVMVDNGMGRFSHGFRAIEFNEIKAGSEGDSGFEITKAEIMEESLVSVPANTDADTQEVILSLVENGKLTSPVFKEYGKSIRENRNVTIPVNVDVKVLLDGVEVKQNGKQNERPDPSTSKETEVRSEKEGHEGQETSDKEVKPEEKGIDYSDARMGYLEGSWEYKTEKLWSQVREYIYEKLGSEDYGCYILATYDDHALVCVYKYYGNEKEKYYKVNWKEENGIPKFHGDLVELSIQVETTIAEKNTLNVVKEKMAKLNSEFSISDILVKADKQQKRKLLEVLSHLDKLDQKQQNIERFKKRLASY